MTPTDRRVVRLLSTAVLATSASAVALGARDDALALILASAAALAALVAANRRTRGTTERNHP